MKKNILVTAGEASGDLHASNLIKQLNKTSPGLNFFGMGGKRMQAQGVRIIRRMDELSIIGVGEIFPKLARIHSLFRNILREVDSGKTDLAILVDYPGFNLALARELKKRNIPIVYYITPQVWAWGRSRITLIKKYFVKAITIFEFEKDLFRRYGIDAEWAGHPLLDLEESRIGKDEARESLGAGSEDFIISLLPGSRRQEIIRILPLMLKTGKLILREKPFVKFVILESENVEEPLYDKILEKNNLPVKIVRGKTYTALAASDFVFTTSGTATLEACIMGKPMIITYKIAFLTFLLAKMFADIPPVGLVNIIAKKYVSPEILQYDANPRRLASEILSIISSEGKMREMISELKKVKEKLGVPGASRRAAEIISGLL